MIYIRIKGEKNRNYQGFFNNFPEKFQKHLKFTENYLKSQKRHELYSKLPLS